MRKIYHGIPSIEGNGEVSFTNIRILASQNRQMIRKAHTSVESLGEEGTGILAQGFQVWVEGLRLRIYGIRI